MVLELIKLLCTNTVVTRLSPASELVKTVLSIRSLTTAKFFTQ